MAVAAMKHIGILGTIIPSLKTLFKFKKIFTQLTLTLILPLVIIFLTNIDITNRFYHYNVYNPYQMLFHCYFIYITYDGSYGGAYHKAGQPTYSHVLLFIHLFSILMIALFYILTTITIVYTITAKDDVTYYKALKVTLKMWERLADTFHKMLTSMEIYTVIVYIFCKSIIMHKTIAFYFVFMVVYILGYLYLSVVWQLASVISVVEESCYGLRSVKKAMKLVKGNMLAACMVSLAMYVLIGSVVFIYTALVVYNGAELVLMLRMIVGIVCGVLLMVVFLFNMVIHTNLYLVCKRSHPLNRNPLMLV
ncbi:hypothetical protein Tco_0205688 [Tanacetum coccineum]